MRWLRVILALGCGLGLLFNPAECVPCDSPEVGCSAESYGCKGCGDAAPPSVGPRESCLVILPFVSCEGRQGRCCLIDHRLTAVTWSKAPTLKRPVPVYPDWVHAVAHADDRPGLWANIAARGRPPPLASRTRRALLCVRTI
jgi:hypothetical protein